MAVKNIASISFEGLRYINIVFGDPNDKDDRVIYTLKELPYRKLQKLVSNKVNFITNEIQNLDFKDEDNLANVFNKFIGLIEESIVDFCPGLTDEMLDKAYMSQMEKLIQGFIDVNFTGLRGLKNIFGSLLAKRPTQK